MTFLDRNPIYSVRIDSLSNDGQLDTLTLCIEDKGCERFMAVFRVATGYLLNVLPGTRFVGTGDVVQVPNEEIEHGSELVGVSVTF